MRKCPVLLLMLLCIALPLPAEAVTVDYTRTGDLRVQMDISSSVEISLYRIGEVENANEDLRYHTSGEFAPCTVDLNYTSADEAEAAAEIIGQYVSDRQLQPLAVRKSDSDGLVTFENLSVGVYYAEKSGGAKEVSVLPFIVTVPYYKDGELLYTVPVNPKTEILPTPTPTPTPPSDSKLPQTGLTRWPVVALSIGGCLLVALGVVLVLLAGRKQDKK